ncbi:Histone transcription regulator 3 [Lunasporangiospora selenospora]|uniref:Histone transcription regulator 3 n=1 Tax=Lunasporangiospora selenospora TaxID=979761 RepID=A0A9P6KHK4_9FUNG|nr:Histone transcription regulator 3 [Lunasporangiospora selenospora]
MARIPSLIRFAVLNEEEQTKREEEESVEIQAEKCLGIYRTAIRLLQRGKLDDARVMLKDLIESDLLQMLDTDSELATRGTPLRLLQYLVYTNYASILEESSEGSPALALQFYLKPKELYLENITWLDLGKLMLTEYKFQMDNADTTFCNRRLAIRTEKEKEQDRKGVSEEDTPMTLQAPVDTEEEVEIIKEESGPADERNGEDVCMFDEQQPSTDGSAQLKGPSEDFSEQPEKEPLDTEQAAALKRKRKEVEERSGLRTSKRVRDKLDQFEVTKKKREEEELEILAKYRIVLSKFGMDLENAFVCKDSVAGSSLEDIFPTKLSNLLNTINKHLEKPGALVQASAIEHVQQQKTNHFAIFTQEKVECMTVGGLQDELPVTEFINRMNEANSGVVSYLCEYVMSLISGLSASVGTDGVDRIPNWQRRWPEGLKAQLSTILSVIGDQLVEYLQLDEPADGETKEGKQQIKLELKLSVCEMYLDEIVTSAMQPFTVVTRRGRGVKKVDTENTTRLEKHLRRWLFLAGLESASELNDDNDDEGQPSRLLDWRKTADIRMCWLLGRYAQCKGNAGEAISNFEDCSTAIRESSITNITLPNCKYDSLLNIENVQKRLSKLKTHQYVLDAERLFSENDFEAVMTRLEPIFLSKYSESYKALSVEENVDGELSDSLTGPLSERMELMGLLYKSCDSLQQRPKQLQCAVEMYMQIAEALVGTVTEKSEASELWYLLTQCSSLLFHLRETLQTSTLNDLLGSLDPSRLQKLVCGVLAIVRLGFVNILHQDRLVDDDIKVSYSSLLKFRPHLEQFNIIMARAWLVLLLLLPAWFNEDSSSGASDEDQDMTSRFPLVASALDMGSLGLDPETIQRVLLQPLTSNSSTALNHYSGPSRALYMELIALIHDDLGVREMCGIEGGHLTQLALKVSSPMSGEFYRKEENQCYYCIYGISLSVDGQYPIEHSSVPVDFDKKAAIEFFPLLERSLSDRAIRGQMRSDLKDAVDRVEEALGAPPYESNAVLAMNREIIDGYLASEINFAEAIQVSSPNRLPTMEQPPSSKLASVYKTIYAIQGKIFLSQFKNKAKSSQFKPLEDLQHAIDQFRSDIHVNPDSWDSWYALASCYSYLADENLVFSAADIKNNYTKITDLQRRAFHCFAQAVRLCPKKPEKSEHSEGSGKPDCPSAPTNETSNSHDGQLDTDMDSTWEEPVREYSSSDQEESVGQEPAAKKVRKLVAKTAPVPEENWHQKQATFWYDFGYLLYGIMSQPMRMQAMRRSSGVETLCETGGTTTIEIPEPVPQQVYKFAVFCFKRSLSLQDQGWRTPWMLAKCLEKLEGKPDQVMALYRHAADKVPIRAGQLGNEKVFEPAYKLISTLTKYLAAGKIKPAAVESLLRRTFGNTKLNATDGEASIFEAPKMQLEEGTNAENEKDQRTDEELEAFRCLCEGLARIRQLDKRHWHHRPVFRQAWILHYVYHDAERAKAEILGLFQIKSNQKTLVSSVWKPEYERCGKHFVYVGEYTKFLILLAKETKDVETLNTLARKVRRANSLLLDLKEIWEQLYDAYLSVLQDLVGPDPHLSVAEVIPRTEFREKAAIYEAKMFEQEPKLPRLTVLQRLSELKKLNDKMAPEGQIGHLLAVCYSKLFIEVGGSDLYPKELLWQLSNNVEPYSVTPNGTHTATDEPSTIDNVTGTGDGSGVVTSSKRVQYMDEDGEQDDGARVKIAKVSMPVAIAIEREQREPNTLLTTDGHEEKEKLSGQSSINKEPPGSPAPSTGGRDEEAASKNPDMEPDMEDWKSRKKISATELASRATAMCKAPPPSLKAPQSLQSRAGAGPSPDVGGNHNPEATSSGTDAMENATDQASTADQDAELERQEASEEFGVSNNLSDRALNHSPGSPKKWKAEKESAEEEFDPESSTSLSVASVTGSTLEEAGKLDEKEADGAI